MYYKNTLDKFEKGEFHIERDGKIIALTEREMSEFRRLDVALTGRSILNCLETGALDCYEADIDSLVEEMKKNESICYELQSDALNEVSGATSEAEEAVAEEYIQKYLQLFKEKMLSEKDFIFEDELCFDDCDNMIDGYLWAMVPLVERMRFQENLYDTELYDIDFYAFYNGKDIKIEGSYCLSDDSDTEIFYLDLFLFESEKKTLIKRLEQYCIKAYQMSLEDFMSVEK